MTRDFNFELAGSQALASAPSLPAKNNSSPIRPDWHDLWQLNTRQSQHPPTSMLTCMESGEKGQRRIGAERRLAKAASF
ncbi:MAG: hypothetical protein QM757_01680 [Paludibaculum sp.]